MKRKICFVFLAVLCGFFLIFNSLLMLIMPQLLITEIIFIILEFVCIKIIKNINLEIKQKKNFENQMLKQGYKKICDKVFINEQEYKININGKDYGFADIKNCDLIMNDSVNTYIYNNISTSHKICTGLYINVIVDDFENSNIKINFVVDRIYCDSRKYKIAHEEADKTMSVLKLIISKNNEKYVENGTVTKVEHRYITEENTSKQIERLSQLYKDGVLSEYEFEIKKKELLDN